MNKDPEFFVVKNFINSDYAKQWAKDGYIEENPMYHPFENFNGFLIDREKCNVDPENKLKEVIDFGYYYFNKKYSTNDKMVIFDRSHGQAMNEGAWLVSHKDVYDPKDLNTGPGNALVCNLFLTDDYDGGELIFEEIGVELKPSAGDLVVFPGFLLKHGVKTVKSGRRMNVVNHFFLIDVPDKVKSLKLLV